MFRKFSISLLLIVFCYHTTNGSYLHVFNSFVMNKTGDYMNQNETRNPATVFESLNRIKELTKLTSHRQGKSQMDPHVTFNETIQEYDYAAEKLLANGKISNKSQKKVRTAVKDLRNLVFNLGDRFLKSCQKSYNRHVLFSTELTLQMINSRRNVVLKEFEQEAHQCFKTLDVGKEFTENAEQSMARCYDQILEGIALTILNGHRVFGVDNDTAAVSFEILQKCSKEHEEEVAFCIEDEGLKLNNAIVDIGAKVLRTSAESAVNIAHEGEVYSKCLETVNYKLEEFLRRNRINVKNNCKWQD